MLHSYPSPRKLRAMRRRCLLTLADAAMLTGVGRNTIWHWEAGRRSPQTRTLKKVLAAYSIRLQAARQREQVWQGGKHA